MKKTPFSASSRLCPTAEKPAPEKPAPFPQPRAAPGTAPRAGPPAMPPVTFRTELVMVHGRRPPWRHRRVAESSELIRLKCSNHHPKDNTD